MRRIHFRQFPGVIVLAAYVLIAGRLQTAHSQDAKENAEFKLAVNLYNDRMFDLAGQQFRNFIAAYPNTSQGIEARFYLGLTQMKLKQYDEARTTFQNFALAYVDHPKAPDAWMNVGNAFLALHNEREAASAYERVKVFHAKSPLAAEGLLNAAQLYRQIGEREHAKQVLRAIIQDYPSSKSVLPARLAISEMYADEGQTDLAEREARHVVESDVAGSVKASALFAIGKLKESLCLFDDAETIFKNITGTYKEAPAALSANFELGKLALSLRNSDVAIEYFKKIVNEDGADDSLRAKAMFETGSAYAELRRYPDAEKYFDLVVSTFPKNNLVDSALFEAAGCAFLNVSYDAALHHLKNILSNPSSPLHPRALILAAEICDASRNYSECVKYYSLFLDSYPDHPYCPKAILQLGDIYERQFKDYRKAMMLYDQVVQKFPTSWLIVSIFQGIGRCQESLGDYEGALKAYQEELERYPANDNSEYLRKHITFLQHHRIKNRDSGMEKLALLVGEVLTQKSKGELSLRLGKIYFDDLKDYPAAAKQFGAAIDNGLDEQQFIDAYYYRARSYHLQSEIDSSAADQAILYYDAFLKQFPAARWNDEAAFYSFTLKSARKTPAEIILLGETFLKNHPSAPYRDEVYYAVGFNSEHLGKHAEAKAYYEHILSEFPNSQLKSSALYRAGSSYLQLNKPDSTELYWKTAAQVKPPDESALWAMFNLAQRYLQHGQYQEAESLMKRISTELFYCGVAQQTEVTLADIYLANAEFDHAIGLVHEVLLHQEARSFPTSLPFNTLIDAQLIFKLATAYDKKGDKQLASRYYSKFLFSARTGKNIGNAFYALGILARAQNRTSDESAYFRQAAKSGGEDTVSRDVADLLFQTEEYYPALGQYMRLAQSSDSLATREKYWSRVIVSYLRLDSIKTAQGLIADFEKTYGKDKLYRPEFEYERGAHYYRRQDYVNARKIFEKLADDFSDTRFGPWGQYYLGKISEVNSKLDEAAKKYESVLKKYPSSDVIPRVLLSLGNMHFNAERFEEAIRYYQRITDTPNTAGDILPYAMNNLIEAYESTKLYDASLKTAKDFIERYPNDESVIDKKIKIGTLYTKIGYYDQAVLHFQNLLDEAGSLLEAEIRYDIGEAYYYKGEYEQAILEFLKVPYLVSKQGKVNWTATSFYMAGQSYEKMSRFSEAIDMYQQIIERPGIDATFKAGAKKEIDRVKSLIKKTN